MTNFNNDACELDMDALQLASGGNGVSFTLFGHFIHIGTDQTGAPYISIHSTDGKSGTTYRGEPA
jgi:hypothetical protein